MNGLKTYFDASLTTSPARHLSLVLLLLAVWFAPDVLAHNVSREDAERIAGQTGWHFGLFTWLGAKHMVTGYDHLLFLVGVVFYLRDFRSIALYVSLFALGHTITLVSGVWFGLDTNPYLIDAIIGLSVAYKGFDNLGGFTSLFGEAPDERLAVFIFGLFHGLGLATKLQELQLSKDGLLANLLSFNLGVELGQLAALAVILFALRLLPGRTQGSKVAIAVNVGLIIAGFALMSYQLGLYFSA